mmetsp:Transcript_71894/g.159923  ORF Transcript_71894/g.159923 Transcript_71894/m.159923 type:complete len:203 (+) Transcript_71894:290-898(+)
MTMTVGTLARSDGRLGGQTQRTLQSWPQSAALVPNGPASPRNYPGAPQTRSAIVGTACRRATHSATRRRVALPSTACSSPPELTQSGSRPSCRCRTPPPLPGSPTSLAQVQTSPASAAATTAARCGRPRRTGSLRRVWPSSGASGGRLRPSCLVDPTRQCATGGCGSAKIRQRGAWLREAAGPSRSPPWSKELPRRPPPRFR